jgi:[acyl-carrier-protein] S-malonyltransferase
MDRRIALLFPGQGAQKPGMGRPWADRPGWRLVARASELTGRDVAAMLLDADAETLRRTDVAQLATLVLELVVLTELDGLEVPGGNDRVVAVAGHSLGEYAALVAAGVLTADDAIRLVDVRGRAMLAACRQSDGTMAAVIGLAPAVVEALVDELVDELPGAPVAVANLNSPTQVVVTGTVAGIEALAERATAAGAVKVVRLAVDGAFHGPLMAPARPALEIALRATRFGRPRVPVVSNVDAAAHDRADVWAGLLSRQLTAPVRWLDGLHTLTGSLGADLLLEVGPGQVLSGLARAGVPQAARRRINEPADLAARPAAR